MIGPKRNKWVIKIHAKHPDLGQKRAVLVLCSNFYMWNNWNFDKLCLWVSAKRIGCRFWERDTACKTYTEEAATTSNQQWAMEGVVGRICALDPNVWTEIANQDNVTLTCWSQNLADDHGPLPHGYISYIRFSECFPSHLYIWLLSLSLSLYIYHDI